VDTPAGKALAWSEPEIDLYDDDLAVLVDDSMIGQQEAYTLDYIHVTSGSTTTAQIR
jgi:hypothetical protein